MIRSTGWAQTVLLGCAVLLFAGVNARAQTVLALCSASVTPVNFGIVNPTTGLNTDTTGTLSVTCTGLSLAGAATVCVSIGPGSGGATSAASRNMVAGVAQMSFGLYQNSGYSQPFGGLWSSPSEILAVPVTIPLLGSATVTRSVYGRIPAQTGVAVGDYTSTLAVTSTNALVLNLGGCNSQVLPLVNTSSFVATAKVQNACKLVVNDLDFGSHGLLKTSIDRSTTIDATCTAGTPYTLAIGPGLSGATDPALRRMMRGSEGLTYGLYRDPGRSLPWGWSSGVNTFSGTGAGAKQMVPVYGRVPAQTSPSPGTYTDTVVVTLTY